MSPDRRESPNPSILPDKDEVPGSNPGGPTRGNRSRSSRRSGSWGAVRIPPAPMRAPRPSRDDLAPPAHTQRPWPSLPTTWRPRTNTQTKPGRGRSTRPRSRPARRVTVADLAGCCRRPRASIPFATSCTVVMIFRSGPGRATSSRHGEAAAAARRHNPVSGAVRVRPSPPALSIAGVSTSEPPARNGGPPADPEAGAVDAASPGLIRLHQRAPTVSS